MVTRAFIHNSCRSLKLTHGNIKLTNILLDKVGTACVLDFGLSAFAPPSTAPRSNGYRAPESIDGRKLTQKSDVYSLGVLLLELLTGKCPSVVENGGPGTEISGSIAISKFVAFTDQSIWVSKFPSLTGTSCSQSYLERSLKSSDLKVRFLRFFGSLFEEEIERNFRPSEFCGIRGKKKD